MPIVSVVIVTHNSSSVVGSCLDALPEALARYGYEVIVVDNASRDPTREVLLHKPVRFIGSDRNVGFAAACNRGMAVATGRHILLLNPDTWPMPGSLDALVDVLDGDPSVGVVAPRLLNPDGADQQTARRFPTPAAAVLGRRSQLAKWLPNNRWTAAYLMLSKGNATQPYPIDWVSGACLMTRREILDTVGCLDERFFMYWEDADWCRRIKQAGRSVVCVPTVHVIHDEGARRRVSPAQVWHFHRSAYSYYAQHDLLGRKGFLRPVVLAALLSRAVAIIFAHSVADGVRWLGRSRV
jgi:GT2 family glycosyltransferase